MWQRLLQYAWALLVIASFVVVPRVWGDTQGPLWTIGHAVIVKHRRGTMVRPGLYLKLSLRNIGQPGRVPVRIFARWAMAGMHQGMGHSTWHGSIKTTPTGAAGRWAIPHTVTPQQQKGLPPGMYLLGQYTREVSLNQTTILEVPLTRLGMPRRNATRLEVMIMTASVVTDHRFVMLMTD